MLDYWHVEASTLRRNGAARRAARAGSMARCLPACCLSLLPHHRAGLVCVRACIRKRTIRAGSEGRRKKGSESGHLDSIKAPKIETKVKVEEVIGFCVEVAGRGKFYRFIRVLRC